MGRWAGRGDRARVRRGAFGDRGDCRMGRNAVLQVVVGRLGATADGQRGAGWRVCLCILTLGGTLVRGTESTRRRARSTSKKALHGGPHRKHGEGHVAQLAHLERVADVAAAIALARASDWEKRRESGALARAERLILPPLSIRWGAVPGRGAASLSAGEKRS